MTTDKKHPQCSECNIEYGNNTCLVCQHYPPQTKKKTPVFIGTCAANVPENDGYDVEQIWWGDIEKVERDGKMIKILCKGKHMALNMKFWVAFSDADMDRIWGEYNKMSNK